MTIPLSIPLVQSRRIPNEALFAQYLDFVHQNYWIAASKKALLSSVPGYAFARTGQQGAVDSDGGIDFFAAAVPAINGGGYHCFGAVTNLIFPSSMGTGLTDPNGGTGAVSSSGATTATFTGTAGATQTAVMIAKASTSSWLMLSADNSSTNGARAWFNLATGALGSTNTFGTGFTVVGSSIAPLANGFYLCVLQFQSATETALRHITRPVASDLATSNNNAIIVYHRQLLNGNYPQGGPLIVTTGATAALGASDLELGATLPAGDFIAWAPLTLRVAAEARAFSYSTTGAGSSNDRLMARLQSGLHLEFQPVAGGVAQPAPSTINSAIGVGRQVPLLGRRNSKYISAIKKVDGSIIIRDDASGTGALPTVTAVEIGCDRDGTSQVNGPVDGFYQKNGTFSDAEITAILQAA